MNTLRSTSTYPSPFLQASPRRQWEYLPSYPHDIRRGSTAGLLIGDYEKEVELERKGSYSKTVKLGLHRPIVRSFFYRKRPRRFWLGCILTLGAWGWYYYYFAMFGSTGRNPIGVGVGVGTPHFGAVRQAKDLFQHHHCQLLGRFSPGCSTTAFGKPLSSTERHLKDGHSKVLVYEVFHGLMRYPATSTSASSHSNSSDTQAEDLSSDTNSQGQADAEFLHQQPHPIHHLMKNAEREWNEKLAHQSRTLKEAIAEYRHRYHQAPPKGFEQWYTFATRNHVQMIDEYDSIYERILPFAAIPRDVLKARAEMLRNDEGFWLQHHGITISIQEGGRNVSASGPMSNHVDRTAQVMDLVKDIAPLLPTDVNFTFTGHDVPWIVMSGEQKQKHIAAALGKQYLPMNDLDNFGDHWTHEGWATMCTPETPLRTASPLHDRLAWKPQTSPSFIKDHVKAMDLCHHPENQAIHGFTSWQGPRPALLFPMFSFTSSHLHNDLLLPALEQYDRPVGPDPVWRQKTTNKVVWRGSTTGSDLSLAHMRKWSQRPRLVNMGKQPGEITVPLATEDVSGKPGPVISFTAPRSTLAAEYFDFRFMGRPQQCGTTEMCKAFEDEYEWDTFMSEAQQNEYKYVIDVDGNGWSGRFHRLMASNSLVLKSTIFPEWYAERIQPWYHYVPVNVDYEDLYRIMAFFKGDLQGKGAHDELAEKIAKQGTAWTEQTWRWVDMQAYLFRLLLEYTRVMERDPDDYNNMDYVELH